MSTITDVSSVLSEYMLKGWVLTDELCRNSKCNVPLMRSPKGQNPVVHFCANCDGGPLKVSQHSDSPSASSTYSGSQRHTISRSSTPATEVSDASSSDGFQLPPETPESRRRREQSDFASTQIGQRLLKGWALLAEECLNENCFAVPLVRPPKTAGGEKDPRKECVLCGRIYINDGDLVEGGHPALSSQVPTSQASLPVTKSPAVSLSDVAITSSKILNQTLPQVQTISRDLPVAAAPASSTLDALNITSNALEQTLVLLSGRLTSGASMFTDSQTISTIVDTIHKTTQALSEVKKLQQSKTYTSYD